MKNSLRGTGTLAAVLKTARRYRMRLGHAIRTAILSLGCDPIPSPGFVQAEFWPAIPYGPCASRKQRNPWNWRDCR
jgi:hypothetical protein